MEAVAFRFQNWKTGQNYKGKVAAILYYERMIFLIELQLNK